MKRINYLFMMLLALGTKVYGQEMDQDLFDLSLEELMNIEIVSASKKAESSFKSPLSSTVLTKDEILASGATTIEEALRLVPGMLIREETNGNFDVHVRGNDNLPPGNYVFYTENSMSLVMIDGRPVYNYINGGTFWEALPISLVDVERIEVVRGPATALYGPNAATGAINIITKQATDNSISVNGNAQLGTKNTGIYDLSLGTSLLDNKLKVRVSGNIENRDRDMEDYYSYVLGEFVPGDEVIDYSSGGTSDSRYPKPKLAKERKGANAFLSYDMNEKVNFRVNAGIQESYAQSVFMEQTTAPLNLRYNKSNYVDLAAQVHGFNVQYSINNGITDILAGNRFNSDDPSGYAAYDFDASNLNVEYDLNIGKLTLRPGINYQSAVYSDLAYTGGENHGFLNGEKKLYNTGYFLRGDFKATDKLRLIAAVRYDDYNVPDDDYTTYQFVGTYSFNDNQMIRLVYSKANRGPFMIDSYSNYGFGTGEFTSPRIEYTGSESLDLPVINMIELGYRGLLSSKVTLDVEVFHTVTSDITSFEPTFFGIDPTKGLYLQYEYVVLDMKAKQTGATFALNFAPTSKVQLKAYATVQQTKLEDYDKKLTSYSFDPSTFAFNLPTTERMNTTHKQTPSIFGGITGNFRPVDKLNLFTGIYYLGSHIYRHDYAATDDSRGEVEVPGKAVVNVKASYNVYKNSSIFINARNAFNSSGQEFGFADEIGGLYLAGINLSF
jgi:iron complex outermembrane receptor protein